MSIVVARSIASVTVTFPAKPRQNPAFLHLRLDVEKSDNGYDRNMGSIPHSAYLEVYMCGCLPNILNIVVCGNMDSLVDQLSTINRSSFTADKEKERRKIYTAATQLVQRLERPSEKILRMILTEPFLMAAVKTASNMGLFAQLNDKAKTTSELAKAIGADVDLVFRLLRMLGTCGWVREVAADAFVGSEFSACVKDNKGIGSAIHHFYDVGVHHEARLPDFLAATGYRNPSDYSDPPWDHMMESPNYWQWMEKHPEAHVNFNNFLAAMRAKQSPWTMYYPINEQLLQDFDINRPLLVDVGGGKGSDLMHFTASLPESLASAKLILQDTRAVIETVDKSTLAPQICAMAHDFFDSQPPKACGAKAYFMRNVLHDWPEKEALQILAHLKAAMKPGYSKLLVFEAVLSDRVSETTPLMAAMDLNMMVNFGALERTESQWAQLFQKAGLVYQRVHRHRDKNHGILEIVVR